MVAKARPAHLTALFAVYAALVVRFWFLCDDAFITFRFARNWVTGQGLTFNPGDVPAVEGYSNFGWLVLCALFEALGIPSHSVVPWISAACGALLVWRVHLVARRELGLSEAASLWGTLAVAASPAVGVWASSGLATMPFALLFFALAERWLLSDRSGDWRVDAALAVALTLIRIEGFAWVITLALGSVVLRRSSGSIPPTLAARLGRALLAVAAVFGLYTAWRVQLYGTWLPHTALAKVSFGPRLLWRGVKYVGLFWLTCLVPLLTLLSAGLLRATEQRTRWLAVLTLALAFPAYAVAVGGDFMPFGRLLLPSVPFVGLLLAGVLQEVSRRSHTSRAVSTLGIAALVLTLLPAADVHLVPEGLRQRFHVRLSDKAFLSESRRWSNQAANTVGFTMRGRALAQIADPRDSVVAGAVGAVGYFSGIEVLDQHGLVTKEVAYRPVPDGPLRTSPGHDKHVPPEFFVKYAPRFLYARAVDGKLAAGRMKDALEQWDVPTWVMDRYVPDYYEVQLPETHRRAFLFVVRRAEATERPDELWNGFAARRRKLNTELRAQYPDDPDESAPPSG